MTRMLRNADVHGFIIYIFGNANVYKTRNMTPGNLPYDFMG